MRKKNVNRFYYKKDRLNQLRGFCTAVQCGCSATKAAETLELEPATIGQQIKTLEDELNIDLFDRKYSNKLVLTEEGKKFYETAVPALQHIDGIFQNFNKNLDEERKNSLKIAGHYIVLSEILPKYIKELLQQKNLRI